ncbi:MAG: hypothetical protein GX682_02520 [Clostridiaceae bacterium]|nr:hypothetical protein [Clostridiaceae bacterium]
MAYQKYQGYQYETSPRKLQPEFEPKTNPYQKKKSSVKKQNNVKKQVKSQIKPKQKAIIYIAIGFAILFAISYQNSLITESFNKKEELKTNLGSIEKENEQLKINIEKTLNLNNVEQSAKEMLGMQKLSNAQKIYINLPKKDYIESANEEKILEENLNIFEKIMNIFKK